VRKHIQADPPGHADYLTGTGQADRPIVVGFVYCVSVAGITGERAALPAELLEQLRWLRGETSLPLCGRLRHQHADTCACCATTPMG